jgi:hypothetical protein
MERAAEHFDFLGVLLVDIFFVEQKAALDKNLLHLFPILSRPGESSRIISRSELDVDSRFFWHVGRITRENVYPDIFRTASLPSLPATVEFIDVKLCRFSPSHFVLCFIVGLSPEVTKGVLDRLSQPYSGSVQRIDIKKHRGSVEMLSPEMQRHEALAGEFGNLVAQIENALRPFVRGGYFTEFQPNASLGRVDIVSVKGFRTDPGPETQIWQDAMRPWSAPLGLLWGASYNWNDASVFERESFFGSEHPWRLLIKPEAIVPRDTSDDQRKEILRVVGNQLGGLASIVAFDRFAVIQQNLLASFRESVFEVARRKRFAYLSLSKHSQIQQRVLASLILVQSLSAGLTRSSSWLSHERFVGDASYSYEGHAQTIASPFVQTLKTRFASIHEEMDRAAKVLSGLLAARNLVAIYVLTWAIFLFTVFGVMGLGNIRSWAEMSWAAVHSALHHDNVLPILSPRRHQEARASHDTAPHGEQRR